jgi:HAD superfamily hydrolase (TIGR01662 family)
MTSEAKRVRAVLFDLGGTLVETRDFDGWAEDGQAVGLQFDAEGIAGAWEAAEPWRDGREADRVRLWRDVLARASGSDVSEAVVGRFLARHDRRPIHGRLFSDVRRCLDRLMGPGRELGIVSNSRSEPAVRELLRNVRIAELFSTVVSSGTEGVRKPDPEIYRRALVRLRASPAESLFVGDDLANDVQGPMAVGLHAVWLNRMGTGGEGDFPEILSLSELPRIVRLIEAGAPVK